MTVSPIKWNGMEKFDEHTFTVDNAALKKDSARDKLGSIRHIRIINCS